MRTSTMKFFYYQDFSKIVVDNQENADVDYGKRQKFYEQFWYDEF